MVNRAQVLGMRAIGKGRAAANKLSGFLDIPQPVAQQHGRKHTKDLAENTADCAEKVMADSVSKLKRLKLQTDDRETLASTVVDCAVSMDGSWLTRGCYSRHSFIGVVSVNTGECLDRIYMCSTCSSCKLWEGKSKYSAEYMEFFQNHFTDCPLNHDGSSQSIEAEGVERLFGRSQEKNGLRYTTYVGDGDSKSYQRVVQAQPYGPDVTIVKEECIGHVQKRMGSRLRALVNRKKGVKLSDGKNIQGKGRLTQKRIDSFQVFYEIVLRSNRGDLEALCRSTLAILMHYSDSAEDVRHQHCPNGVLSCCKYTKDKATGQHTYRTPKNPLTPAIVDELKPVLTRYPTPDCFDPVCSGSPRTPMNPCIT